MLLSSANDYKGAARRIVSLVPSQTELLHYLGLQEQVAGITKFCIHPEEWFRNKIRVGGTKNINTQTIDTINPDLIIANREENMREQVEQLAIKFEVFVTDINCLADALVMINDIGRLTHREPEAMQLCRDISAAFSELPAPDRRIPAAYLIWKDPLMAAGGNTFINDMLSHAGFENVFAGRQRYPELSFEDIRQNKPEVILLSSEPYPFRQKHISWLQAELPGIEIMLADGEMFSWYGSRLLQAPAYFKSLHKELNIRYR